MKKAAVLLCLLASSLFSKETNLCPWIRDYILPVPDFPKKGILFQCYHDLFKDPAAMRRAIEAFKERYRDFPIDVIAGLDARGFIFGGILAYELNLPFLMIRKPSKLPRPVEKIRYEMEFGENSLEVEIDSVRAGDRVLIIDDVIATGGTAGAAAQLIEKLGGVVMEIGCLMELPFFKGRENLKWPVFSLVSIEMD